MSAGALGAPRAIPTVWVAGRPDAATQTLVQAWGAAPPAGERWVRLSAQAPQADPGRALVWPWPAVCACCVGPHAVAQALGRLLRAGPWDRILIEASLAQHATGLIDVLHSPVFAAWFRLLPPVLVWPGQGASASLLELAPVVVLAPSAGAAPAWLTDAPADPLQPRVVLPLQADSSPWPAIERAWAALAPDPLPAVQTLPWGEAWVVLARWPAQQGFDRARLAAVLAKLVQPNGPARRNGLRQMRARLRTARAWYDWTWQDTATHLHTQETAWRVDNRVGLIVKEPLDAHIVVAALQSALDVPGLARVAPD